MAFSRNAREHGPAAGAAEVVVLVNPGAGGWAKIDTVGVSGGYSPSEAGLLFANVSMWSRWVLSPSLLAATSRISRYPRGSPWRLDSGAEARRFSFDAMRCVRGTATLGLPFVPSEGLKLAYAPGSGSRLLTTLLRQVCPVVAVET